MDISLSFKITRILGFRWPLWLKASNAIPAVIAPSPITATCFLFESFFWAPTAIPNIALIEVLEWPTPKASYALSLIVGKGANPSFLRTVWILSFLPVKILWGYAWCPTSHTKLSYGVLYRWWRTTVNSITPSPPPRCPPVCPTENNKNSLNSSDKISSSAIENDLMSDGAETLSSKGVIGLVSGIFLKIFINSLCQSNT